MVLVLPLLSKIQNLKLNLSNYQLNTGQCKSLGAAMSMIPESLTSIMLNKNGLRDADMAAIIEGMNALKESKSLVIKNNEFLQNSFKSLQAILDRPMPTNLEELRIVNCKTSSLVTDQLLE